MNQVKNWHLRQDKLVMLLVLVRKLSLVWSIEGNYLGLTAFGISGFPWMHLSSGLGIKHILRIACSRGCKKEQPHV